MLSQLVLCLALLAGEQVVPATHERTPPGEPLSQGNFFGVWEAVDWETLRIIRLDVQSATDGYLAVRSAHNRAASLYAIRRVEFLPAGRVRVEAQATASPAMRVRLEGEGRAANGLGLLRATVEFTTDARLRDRWPNATFVARQGSALEDVAELSRQVREEIERQRSQRKR